MEEAGEEPERPGDHDGVNRKGEPWTCCRKSVCMKAVEEGDELGPV